MEHIAKLEAKIKSLEAELCLRPTFEQVRAMIDYEPLALSEEEKTQVYLRSRMMGLQHSETALGRSQR